MCFSTHHEVDTKWVPPTKFQHYLPRDSVISCRLRAQSQNLPSHPTCHNSSPLKLLTNQIHVGVPMIHSLGSINFLEWLTATLNVYQVIIKHTDEETYMWEGVLCFHALPRQATLQELPRVQLSRSSLNTASLGFYRGFIT